MSEPTTTQPRSNEHPFGTPQPRWRVWLVRTVVFCVTFVLLLAAFTSLGSIVERFFVAIYTD